MPLNYRQVPNDPSPYQAFLFHANLAIAGISHVVISKISVVLMRYFLFFSVTGEIPSLLSSYDLRRMRVAVGVCSLFAPYLPKLE